jgi:hypothetical protein
MTRIIASDATHRASRKRIERRAIRVAAAKTWLLDRWRHPAGRCVSRVVELIRDSRCVSPARRCKQAGLKPCPLISSD